MGALITLFLVIIGLAAVAAWVWSREEHDHFKYEDEPFLTGDDDDYERFL